VIKLSNRELSAAVSALRRNRPYWGEDGQDAHYSALAKLETELMIRYANAAHARPRRKRGEGAAILAELRRAMSYGFKVRMKYVDGDGEITERVIHPLRFTDATQRRHFEAWCELRGETRNFRTDRIATVTATSIRFRHRES
jgi:predicted DNA-binding transcriptional regulator YafY